MSPVDLYGLTLTGSAEAAETYNLGVGRLLRLRSGALEAVAESIALDPTFALGHADLALLGHELGAPVEVSARLRDAERHAVGASERERSHVRAVARHIAGDSAPVVEHLRRCPRDALLLSVAVPTIAFAGVTREPADAWAIVEQAAPAYGDDWWCRGLLGFVRQSQKRYDEAMALACASLAAEPAAGHSAHARTHAHYETGDHDGGLRWLDGWLAGAGADVDNGSHFFWHAALHELSMGDLAAVRARYESRLAPRPALGCRVLVDTGSLVWRWMLTPGAEHVPPIEDVVAQVEDELLRRPPTPFMALHAAVALCAADDADALATLARWSARHGDATYVEVVAPVALALRRLVTGDPSGAADELGRLEPAAWRLGGSLAQREVLEETRLAALLRAGRYADAAVLVDDRLDRRPCARDRAFRAQTVAGAAGARP
jgi:tetratricopeptide (TPR) repeat protein